MSALADITVDATTGGTVSIKPGPSALMSQPIKLYPQPANDRLFISGVHYQPISVRNLQGDLLQESFYRSGGLDVSGLDPGIYLLEFEGTAQRFVIH